MHLDILRQIKKVRCYELHKDLVIMSQCIFLHFTNKKNFANYKFHTAVERAKINHWVRLVEK